MAATAMVNERLRGASQLLPGRLWIGNKASSIDKEGLKTIGITHIIACAGKPQFLDEFNYCVVHFADSDADVQGFLGAVHSVRQYVNGIDDRNEFESHRILVHCSGGISRSACIAVALLAAEKDLTLADALQMVKERHRQARPRPAFIAALERMQQEQENEETVE